MLSIGGHVRSIRPDPGRDRSSDFISDDAGLVGPSRACSRSTVWWIR